MDGRRDRAAVARVRRWGPGRCDACWRVWLSLACSGRWSAARARAGGSATTTTAAARARAAQVKQRDSHLNGRQLNLAVYYVRTFEGRRYLAPEWHPVPYTRAVAGAAVGELLAGDPYCPGSRRPLPAGPACAGCRSTAGRPPSTCPGPGRCRAGRSRPWSTP